MPLTPRQLLTVVLTLAARALAGDDPFALSPAEDACVKGTNPIPCVSLALDYSMSVQSLNKPGMEEKLAPRRARMAAVATRACELKDVRGCTYALRAYQTGTPTDAEYKEILRVAEMGCKLGEYRQCDLVKARKATGGKPPEAVAKNKDVEATTALMQEKKGNLAGADLHGKLLQGISLSGANLKGANLSGAVLKGASVNGADLTGANLEGASFVDASINEVVLNNASAARADFSGASGMPKSVKGARFDDATAGEALESAPDFVEAAWTGATLSCKWAGRDLHKATLIKVRLGSCDLSGTNLAGVDLSGARFTGGTVENANLAGARFDQAQLDHTGFRDGTDLTGTSFKDADLRSALFTSNKMKGANFTRANLTDARFGNGSNLTGANFERATVCGTGIETANGWSAASSSGAIKVCN